MLGAFHAEAVRRPFRSFCAELLKVGADVFRVKEKSETKGGTVYFYTLYGGCHKGVLFFILGGKL